MASVKKAWIKKYGEQIGLIKWEEQKKKYGKTNKQLEQKHGKNYVKKLNKSKATFCENYYVKKYGKKIGSVKWKDVLDKKIKTQKNNFKNKTWNNGRSLEEYQKRYGVKDGYKRWKHRNNKQSYRFSINYYIKKYGKEIGEQKWTDYCKSMCKTSLDSFINRYGEINGKKRYDEFVKKLSYANSKDYYINKYGNINGLEKWKEYLEKIQFKNSYSKISQELFWSIYDKLSNKYKNFINFHELNNEQIFYMNDKIIKADFKCNNIIIEFDGDYWHNKKDVIRKDKIKNKFFENNNYKILRIKENDYNKNKQEIINKCLKFIKENISES